MKYSHRALLFLLIAVFLLTSCAQVEHITVPMRIPPRVVSHVLCSSLTVVQHHTNRVGSATLIKWHGRYHVVTAAHVILKESSAATELETGLDLKYSCNGVEGSTGFDVHYVDRKADLAFGMPITLPPELAFSPVTLASSEPSVGEFVIAVGSPQDFKIHEQNLSFGVLSKVEECANGQCYRTDADVFFGNSGGGLFNLNGKMIGVTVGLGANVFRSAIPGSGIVVSWRTLTKHLRRLKH